MSKQDPNPCHGGSTSERWVKTPKPPNPIPQPHPGSHVRYKLLALCVGLPLIVANTFSLLYYPREKERIPFVEYRYLRIRNKKFPWGDGDHSLFHNPKWNAISTGYEEVEGEEKVE